MTEANASSLTPNQIKRNVMRAMGIDLPDDIIDTVHDVKFEDGKLKYKMQLPIGKLQWRGCYGRSQT